MFGATADLSFDWYNCARSPSKLYRVEVSAAAAAAATSSATVTPAGDVSWRDVSWRDVSWRDVSWRDVSWRDVSWRDVSWRDVSWRDVITEHVVHRPGRVTRLRVYLQLARVAELGRTERAAELAHARVADHVSAQVGSAREALAAHVAVVGVAAAMQVLVQAKVVPASEPLVTHATVERLRRIVLHSNDIPIGALSRTLCLSNYNSFQVTLNLKVSLTMTHLGYSCI